MYIKKFQPILKKQHELVRTFASLEARREQAIEAAVLLCKEGKALFS